MIKIYRVIEKCRETAPHNSCSECACNGVECLECLAEAQEELENER